MYALLDLWNRLELPCLTAHLVSIGCQNSCHFLARQLTTAVTERFYHRWR